jgi:FMN phosphatase YigB (HAD superfamily)
MKSYLGLSGYYIFLWGRGIRVLKAILFDWHGVLVFNKRGMESITNEIYEKVISNSATESEIIHLVNSFEKYAPLWDLLPELQKHFKMCVINNGPSITFPYWDKYFGYSKYMEFINSEMVGVAKPHSEIYKIACEKLSVETDEVIFMDDNFGFPEETINLNMQFIHWDTLHNGFHKFCEYLKSY